MFTIPLPWNTEKHYWLCLWCDEPPSVTFKQALLAIPHIRVESEYFYYLPTSQEWAQPWYQLKQSLRYAPVSGVHLALIGGVHKPEKSLLLSHEKTANTIDAIAHSLWLGQALLNHQLFLQWQRIITAEGMVFGHEAYARLRLPAQPLIDGGMILHAAKNLKIEAALDAFLQEMTLQHALRHNADLPLFLNMLPGFTLKPEIALARLQSLLASLAGKIPPIILDIPPQGITHEQLALRKTIQSCHREGFKVALGNIRNALHLQPILAHTQPDFLKLDMGLTHFVHHPARRQEIKQIMMLAGKAGIQVIATGVENEVEHEHLLDLGLNLFQGYYFDR